MDHQASREDFELEEAYKPLVGKTLEEVITEGESDWEKDQPQEHITLNSAPQWLVSALTSLKRKHTNVPSVSAVERLTAKLGIVIIREKQGQLIHEVEELRKQIFQLGNQIQLMKAYRGSQYELGESVAAIYRRCALREWVAGAITDNLVDSLGFPFSKAVLVTLIAGISTSDSWLPRSWVKLAAKELGYFQRYLEDEATRLKEILSERL
jgi:hypothetical protein